MGKLKGRRRKLTGHVVCLSSANGPGSYLWRVFVAPVRRETAEEVGHSEFVWVMKELVGQKGTEKEMEYFDLQAYILSHLSHIL